MESGGARLALEDKAIVELLHSWTAYSQILLPLTDLSLPNFLTLPPKTTLTQAEVHKKCKLRLEVAKILLKVKISDQSKPNKHEEDSESRYLTVSLKKTRKAASLQVQSPVEVFAGENFEIDFVVGSHVIQLLKLQRVAVSENYQTSQLSVSGEKEYYLNSQTVEMEGLDLKVPEEIDHILQSLEFLVRGLMSSPESSGTHESESPARNLSPKMDKASKQGIIPIQEVSHSKEFSPQSSGKILHSTSKPKTSFSLIIDEAMEAKFEQEEVDLVLTKAPTVNWFTFNKEDATQHLFDKRVFLIVKKLKVSFSDFPLEVSSVCSPSRQNT